MDSTAQDRVEVRPPATAGIVAGIANALNAMRRLVADLFRLFSLEVRRAGLVLVWMVALGAMAAMLIVTAWLGLMGVVSLWAVSLGFSWAGTLLAIALANLATAAIVITCCMTISRNLLFPVTQRQLDASPKQRGAT